MIRGQKMCLLDYRKRLIQQGKPFFRASYFLLPRFKYHNKFDGVEANCGSIAILT